MSRPSARGAFEAFVNRGDRVPPLLRVDRDVELRPELLELVDRRRTLEVGRDERRLLPVVPQQQRELRRSRRLARPCRPASRITVGDFDENTSRESPVPIRADSSSWTILTTCWPGRQRLEHVLAERAFAHTGREVLDDAEVHVRLEQRKADLAHRAGDRLFVQRPPLAEVAERALQAVGQAVEHGRTSVLAPLGCPGSTPGRRGNMAQVAKVVTIIGSSPESFAKGRGCGGAGSGEDHSAASPAPK